MEDQSESFVTITKHAISRIKGKESALKTVEDKLILLKMRFVLACAVTMQ